jgi:protein TonB
MLAPVPVLHRPLSSPPELGHQNPRPATDRPILGLSILHQPPTIPAHVFDQPSDAPLISESMSPDWIGEASTGSGSATTVIQRPEASQGRPVQRSGGVMEALLIHRVQPVYPVPAMAVHLTGTVKLRAIIGTDGSVRNLEVVSGNPILASAAVDAVRQWRYRPTLLSGKPVEVETEIMMQFQMSQP